MANYTENYQLEKPLPEEFYDVGVQNGNWDKIDTAIAAIDGAKAGEKGDLADDDALPLVDSADSSKTKRVLWSTIKTALANLFVPLTRKVNGKALSEDLTLTGEDIKVSGSDETSISSSLSNKVAKTYTEPSQIGITLGNETIESISTALPNESILMYGVGSSTNTEIYPFRLCTIIVYKINVSRVVWTAIDKSTGKNATGNWSNDLGFTGWEPSATATPPQEYDLPLADGIGSSAKYSKDQFGRVQLRGWITGATANSVVATLPAGFRPASGAHFTQSISSSSQNGIARVVVRTDGTIYVELPQDGNLASGLSLQLSFLAAS